MVTIIRFGEIAEVRELLCQLRGPLKCPRNRQHMSRTKNQTEQNKNKQKTLLRIIIADRLFFQWSAEEFAIFCKDYTVKQEYIHVSTSHSAGVK